MNTLTLKLSLNNKKVYLFYLSHHILFKNAEISTYVHTSCVTVI